MVANQDEKGARTVLFKLIAERDSGRNTGENLTPDAPHLFIASTTN
jgi:hypothetical protein